MAMHPEVLRKAQAEIDAVVGINRLPDFNDRPYLPYINAIMKETMRWQLVLPLGKRFFNVHLRLFIMAGFAHMATEDDEYDGYFIPKGTAVIGAAWYVFRICEKALSIEKLCIGQFCTIPKYSRPPKNSDRSAILKTVK
jgi:cytochrome P450